MAVMNKYVAIGAILLVFLYCYLAYTQWLAV
jgi:hypothetical protein